MLQEEEFIKVYVRIRPPLTQSIPQNRPKEAEKSATSNTKESKPLVFPPDP